jgi:hypothetical protein
MACSRVTFTFTFVSFRNPHSLRRRVWNIKRVCSCYVQISVSYIFLPRSAFRFAGSCWRRSSSEPPAIQHSNLLECRRVTWGHISRNFGGSLCLNRKEYSHINHHQAGNLTPRVRYFGSDFNQNGNVPTNSPNITFHGNPFSDSVITKDVHTWRRRIYAALCCDRAKYEDSLYRILYIISALYAFRSSVNIYENKA